MDASVNRSMGPAEAAMASPPWALPGNLWQRCFLCNLKVRVCSLKDYCHSKLGPWANFQRAENPDWPSLGAILGRRSRLLPWNLP